jgi:hypothetical protein
MLTLVLVIVFVLLRVPMIYGSVIIMMLVAVVMLNQRRDLIRPGFLGAGITLLVYSLLALMAKWIYPSIFEFTWHTDKFLNLFLLGIPIEEMLYGTAAGLLATVCYPFIFSQRFE